MSLFNNKIKLLATAAAGYCVLALLGYQLTVPPGVASAVWPAAGYSTALTMMIGPFATIGTFLGSATASFIHFGADSFNWINVVIGIAAACQSLVFWGLLYRFTIYPDFDDLKSILKFMAIAAASAIASASIGVLALAVGGFSTSILFDWATWWFGDTMGIIICTPLTLIFIGSDEQWRSRKNSLIIASIASCLLYTAILFHINAREMDANRFEINLESMKATEAVVNNIRLAKQSSLTIESIHRITPLKTYEQFSDVARAAKGDQESIRAIEWVPSVPPTQRADFEQKMTKLLGRSFQIKNRMDTQPELNSPETWPHFPIGFIEPLAGNEEALGYDVGSERIRAEAIKRALTTGEPAATPPVKLIQSLNSKYGGILYFVPIKPETGKTEISELFVSVLDLDHVLAPLISLSAQKNIEFVINDSFTNSLLGSSLVNNSENSLIGLQKAGTVAKQTIKFTPESSWDIMFVKKRHSSNHKLYNWMILGLSLILSAGIITGVLLYTGNVRRTDALIAARTHELAATRDEALRAANAKADFLATMSHEIRTPMNGIIGMTEQLAESDLNEEQRFAVRVIQESGGALLSLLNNILDMSKIDAGKIELSNVKFNPQRMLIGVKGLFAPIAKTGKTKFDLEIDPSVPDSVFGDDVRIRQILINIVSNALKFAEGTSVKIRARALISEAHVDLLFDIIDTGQGMNDVQLSRIFKPFSQADAGTTRRFGGTGLGLTIAQNLARLMGGDISVNSIYGQGTTFHIMVKANRASDLPQIEAPGLKTDPISVTFPGLNVMVAEDNATNQIVIKNFLSKLHITPKIANNGEEAVKLIAENRWDVVFMDLHMPVLDGKGATAKIRELGQQIHQPWIIALTADAYESTKKECLTIGMNDFLTKPITKNSLAEVLTNLKQRKAA